MADHTNAWACSSALAAGVAESFEITGSDVRWVELVHHGDQTQAAWYIVGKAVTVPTVAGDGSKPILAGERIRVGRAGHSPRTVITFISSGTPMISVEGIRG